MNIDTDNIFEIGERLARPCLYVSEAAPGEAIIGHWGGAKAERKVEGRHSLWLSMSCAWLRRHGIPLEGYLVVYIQPSSNQWVAQVTPDGPPVTETTNTIALSGREGIALPDTDAIEAYTGVSVDDLVKRGRLKGELVAAYDKHWWETTFHDGCATLGGWRIPWPDDDADAEPTSREFYEGERQLVLRTFCDAEPWVEVWIDDNGHLDVIPRIT